MEQKNCDWTKDEFDKAYHDEEWCMPQHDDQRIFEMLILEGMQAGLSWNTILKKRKNFQKAFDHFDYHKIANYDEQKIQELLNNKGIIRNRLKIKSTVQNAKAFLDVQKEFGSFDTYIWSFTNGKQIDHQLKQLSDMPAITPLSDQISKDLKKRGFHFIGTTICYSFLQSIGIINDHIITCEHYTKCKNAMKSEQQC